MTETLRAELLVDGFTYGEGPRWHEDRLWFTDGPTRAVMTVDEHGDLEVAVRTQHPSGLGWMPDGTLLVSTLHTAEVLRVGTDGVVTMLADLRDQGWSTNDIVVGSGGHAYVDLYRTGGRGEGVPLGDIVLVTPDGAARTVARDLATPNGLAITPDGSTLLVSETFGGRLLAFRIEPDGALTDQRVFADLGHRHPDGVCLDAQGAAWVGCYDTAEFVRVRDGGEITHRVEIDDAWAVAPALGGADRRTLFLVANRTSHEGIRDGRSEGRIEHVRVEVPGAGWP